MEIIKKIGPINLEEISAVGMLYGKIDPKYKSMAYVKALFNENPAGYSIHIFVKDKKEFIGHYCIIPIKCYGEEQDFLSGKAEAFFVKEKYRDSVIELNGKTKSISHAMCEILYDLAKEQGIKVIHVVCDRRLAIFHKLFGFKVYKYNIYNHRFYINYYYDHKFISRLQKLILIFMTPIISIVPAKSNGYINKRIKTNWGIKESEDFIKWLQKINVLKTYGDAEGITYIENLQLKEIAEVPNSFSSIKKIHLFLKHLLNSKEQSLVRLRAKRMYIIMNLLGAVVSSHEVIILTLNLDNEQMGSPEFSIYFDSPF